MAANPTSSVLDYPDFAVAYTDPDSFSVFDNLIAKTISAYRDETGVAQSLGIGASCNLVLEGVNGIRLYVGDGNDGVSFYTSSYDPASNLRTDTRILNIDATSNVTQITTARDVGALRMISADSDNTVQVSSVIMTQCNNEAHLRTDQVGGLYIDNPVRIANNLFVNALCEVYDVQIDNNAVVIGNLTSYGSVFGQNLNVWKQANSNTIGYTFRMNDSDQLELVKYGRFGDGTQDVAKRVMVFGATTLQVNDVSDTPQVGTTAVTGLGAVNLDGSGTPADAWWIKSPNGSVYMPAGTSVGIGIANPAWPLQVSGTIDATAVTAQTVSANELFTTSDRRMKTVIDDHVSSALDAIMAIDVRRFTFNNDTESRVRTGVIAQEVAQVFPDAIKVRATPELDDCLCVDNSVLLAYLIKAVQELRTMLV